MPTESETSQATNYRIGAVAKLTGIAPDTLRVWERRYAVVEPHRTEAGTRVYTRDDVTRLALIKRLVDSGDAIGSVAGLSREELESRVAAATPAPVMLGAAVAGPVQVVVVGEALGMRLREPWQQINDIELVAAYRDAVRLAAEPPAETPDVLVVEFATISEDSAAEAARLHQAVGAGHTFIVFGFGAQAAVQRLNTSFATTVRAPVDATALARLCIGAAAPRAQAAETEAIPEVAMLAPVPKRRYDNATLARVTGMATAVKCECPHHLADLITNLAAFEAYSAQCESGSPEDAALHAYLHVTTARARAMMEEALARVADAERIELEEI